MPKGICPAGAIVIILVVVVGIVVPVGVAVLSPQRFTLDQRAMPGCTDCNVSLVSSVVKGHGWRPFPYFSLNLYKFDFLYTLNVPRRVGKITIAPPF